MKRKMMMMALCAAAVMLAVSAPLVAQTSRTNVATASTFGNDVDNIVSTTDYADVVKDKWFAFTTLTNSNLNLGYATKIAGLYIGTYYDGDILDQNTGKVVTENKTDVITVANGAITSTTTTKSTVLTTDDAFRTNNEFKVLVGVAGMGFRLSLDENMIVNEAPTAGTGVLNTTAGTSTAFSTTVKSEAKTDSTGWVVKTDYSDYFRKSGNMTPSIAWGMKLPLGGMTLIPTAELQLDFQDNKQGYTFSRSTKKDGETVLGEENVNKTYLADSGYFSPKATVKAAIQTAKVDGTQTTFGLGYTFDTNLHTDGAYFTKMEMTEKIPGFGDNVKKTTKYLDKTKSTYTKNEIKPEVSWSKDLDSSLSVGMNAAAAFNIEKSASQNFVTTEIKTTTDVYSQDESDDTVYKSKDYSAGALTVYDTLTVTPNLNLGFVYTVKPSKFNLKGGLAIRMPVLTRTVTTTTRPESAYFKSTTTDGTGAVTATTYTTTSVVNGNSRTESSVVNTRWSSLTTNVYFGSTFDFTPKFSMDMSTWLGNGDPIKLFDMTGSNGLLTNGFSVSFIIKN